MPRTQINIAWKDSELLYCLNVAANGGDSNIGRDLKHVISYLRLQASSAENDGEVANASILKALASHYEETLYRR